MKDKKPKKTLIERGYTKPTELQKERYGLTDDDVLSDGSALEELPETRDGRTFYIAEAHGMILFSRLYWTEENPFFFDSEESFVQWLESIEQNSLGIRFKCGANLSEIITLLREFHQDKKGGTKRRKRLEKALKENYSHVLEPKPGPAQGETISDEVKPGKKEKSESPPAKKKKSATPSKPRGADEETEGGDSYDAYRFQKDGDVWRICFKGESLGAIKDTKGMGIIHTLLCSGDDLWIPAVVLLTKENTGRERSTGDESDQTPDYAPTKNGEKDNDDIVDQETIESCRKKIMEWKESLAKAESGGNKTWADECHREIKKITDYLTPALGLKNTPRKFTNDPQRVADAVSKKMEARVRSNRM